MVRIIVYIGQSDTTAHELDNPTITTTKETLDNHNSTTNWNRCNFERPACGTFSFLWLRLASLLMCSASPPTHPPTITKHTAATATALLLLLTAATTIPSFLPSCLWQQLLCVPVGKIMDDISDFSWTILATFFANIYLQISSSAPKLIGGKENVFIIHYPMDRE